MLEAYIIAQLHAVFMVFCRIGSAMMLMPGIGEFNVPIRVRLLLGIFISLIVAPVIADSIPKMPGNPAVLAVIISSEIVTGIFFGFLCRMIFSCLHTAGMIIAMQSSLAAAVLFDPSQGTQGTAVGNFLSMVALTIMVTLNLHHLMLRGVVETYGVFPPGAAPPLGDFAAYLSTLLSSSFAVAFSLAGPIVAVSVLLYAIAGVLGRLMPQMQVFFVIVPMQLLLTFFTLIVTLTGMMLLFTQHFENTVGGFIP
ncbi:MAG: flagellar biosynthetic protein FliR [Alphaproteobacteria bacterium]|nr:flagellar biosynthetic protein FliR [Alphaproteobacteria bacterium]